MKMPVGSSELSSETGAFYFSSALNERLQHKQILLDFGWQSGECYLINESRELAAKKRARWQMPLSLKESFIEMMWAMHKARISVMASGRGSNFKAILDAIKAKKLNAELVALVPTPSLRCRSNSRKQRCRDCNRPPLNGGREDSSPRA